MIVDQFIGDFPTLQDLVDYPDLKAGDSAYTVDNGHLYIAVQTKLGIDLKQLKVGRGSRGLTGHTGPEGERGPKGPKGDPGQPGRDGRDGYDGPQGPKGPQGAIGLTGPQGPIGPEGPVGRPGRDGVAIAKDGRPGKNGRDGEPGKGWDSVVYEPGTGRFIFSSQDFPELNYSSPPLYIPFFGLSLEEVASKLKPYLND